MKFVPTRMLARPSYAEAWQIAKAISHAAPDLWERLLGHPPDQWKRIIQRAGLRMDDDPVPKAVIDAMDDLDDFKPLLEALHTLQLV